MCGDAGRYICVCVYVYLTAEHIPPLYSRHSTVKTAKAERGMKKRNRRGKSKRTRCEVGGGETGQWEGSLINCAK